MRPRSLTACLIRAGGWATIALAAAGARACPFCGTVGATLAMRRDAAAATMIGTAADIGSVDAALGPVQAFTIVGRLRGAPVPADTIVTARVAAPVAGTAVLFGGAASAGAGDGAPPQGGEWRGVAADEALLAHVAAAPATSLPAVERLPFFAARLEHPDAAIAADSFAEFGQAPFTAVRATAAALAARPLADWLSDPGIDQRRRGFYGLALGIVARAGLPAAAPATSRPLREAIAANDGDFRAGIDGMMAGLLVADGQAGLDWLLTRTSPARPVEQKQFLAALRFATEELAADIPRARILAATALLAASPVVAADAVVDLARLGGWDHLDSVAALWESVGADDPHVRRAVAGYLVACPLPRARAHLERLRRQDPQRLEAAITAASLLRPE